MRRLPRFTEKEIKFIDDAIRASDEEWIKLEYCLNATPFRTGIMNKITKYIHVLQEYNAEDITDAKE